jgi:hypothetical protein
MAQLFPELFLVWFVMIPALFGGSLPFLHTVADAKHAAMPSRTAGVDASTYLGPPKGSVAVSVSRGGAFKWRVLTGPEGGISHPLIRPPKP